MCQIYLQGQESSIFVVNILTWTRVPAESSTGRSDALPLCGGEVDSLGDGSGLGCVSGLGDGSDLGGGLASAVASVAVNPVHVGELLSGAAVGVLIDFLEHRNPGKRINRDNWRLLEDHCHGDKEEVKRRFLAARSAAAARPPNAALLTSTPQELLESLRTPPEEEDDYSGPQVIIEY